jgi:hypothetical protein
MGPSAFFTKDVRPPYTGDAPRPVLLAARSAFNGLRGIRPAAGPCPPRRRRNVSAPYHELELTADDGTLDNLELPRQALRGFDAGENLIIQPLPIENSLHTFFNS